MTESQKLEEKLKQVKEHCEESRESIRNLSLDKEFVTLLMRFEDNDTLFIRVVPKETRIS